MALASLQVATFAGSEYVGNGNTIRRLEAGRLVPTALRGQLVSSGQAVYVVTNQIDVYELNRPATPLASFGATVSEVYVVGPRDIVYQASTGGRYMRMRF